MAEKLHDVRLVGDTESLGGRFGRVRITGDAILAGDVACEGFYLTGTSHIKGSLDSEYLKFTGEVLVDGPMSCGSLRGTGELRLGRNFRGNQVRMSGHLTSQGAIEAEKLELRGAVSGGSVNAGQTLIKLYGPSRVSEVVGGLVTVRRSRGVLFKELFQQDSIAELRAGLIEGDRLDLEHTVADVVRGNTVRIGQGCVIGRVEYRDSYEKSGNAMAQSEYRV
ncbi:hypothetical protein D3P07_23380 [Paenibacillus sp. 1011MAR3C5]|uniref:hypothetical protein n=1 Tax=Paenibacillus sp. 1011MAR3C5 TaxID=1675787 RepID=UPI000E6CD2EF|nr:hypothetical protein [Paenibacillus sp. 1011MAR3C5]RJE84311.1 hypothetical protein D3P07_23380 [Paenibacillus sp. 1011MAR3C5]